MPPRPVIISGIGAINALGTGKSSFWEGLLKSRTGIAPIDGTNTAGYTCNVGGKIKDFKAKDFMPPHFYRRLSRLSRMAVAASIDAVKDCALEISDRNRLRIGVIFGTAFGSTHHTNAFFLSLLEDGPLAAKPILFPDTVPNAPASHVAIFHGLKGPNSTLSQNHISGECALSYAISLLDQDRADYVIVGGVDELSDILLHSLDSVRATKPVRSDNPLPPDRFLVGKGFIPGEGATCLILEREDYSAGRHSPAYGYVSSVKLIGGMAPQGHYEVDGAMLAKGIASAVEAAGANKEEIGIIASASNGVEELERAEELALKTVFGPRWSLIPRVPVRNFVGDFGSAGLLAGATILMALYGNTIPPSFKGSWLSCSGKKPAMSPARRCSLATGLTIGTTFGGGNGCVVYSKNPLNRR